MLILISVIIYCIHSIKYSNVYSIKCISCCYQNGKIIDKDEINKVKDKSLSKLNKSSNDYFILGYYSLNFEQDNTQAKYYFKQVIKNLNEKTSKFGMLYSYYYLCKDAKENGDTDKAIDYAKLSFESVSPKFYGKYKKIIWDIQSQVIDSKKGQLLGVKNLEKIKIYKDYLDDESKMYFSKCLSTLYFLLAKYNDSMENNLDSIELAIKLNKKKELYKGIIDLGILARQIGEYDSAIKVIQSADEVNIDNIKYKSELKCYQLINLAEIECILGNYNKSMSYINKIEGYKKDITNTEKLDDILILINCVKVGYYANNKDFILAKKYLNESKDMLENEKIVFYEGKDTHYYLSAANLYRKEGKYDKSIKNYNELLKISRKKKNIENVELALEGLSQVYSKIGNKEKSYKYRTELLDIKEDRINAFSKNYYQSALHKYEVDKAKKEYSTIKTINKIFKILILILFAIILKFNMYPIIYKSMYRIKIKKYIKENKYFLNYQPIVNPKENKIIGFEALIRLKIKKKLIMPNKIIEEINKCEMMEDLSIYILKRIVKDFNTIKNVENTNDKFYISINLSLKEIESIYIVETFKEIIKESNLPKGSICIEITENANYTNRNLASKNIETLKESGFLIALDDFGMEYSNISILEKFEFDIIKLDKYFIDNIQNSSINKTLMQTADYLSIIKDKTIVVEGVEEDYQMKIIKNTKSNKIYIQGYFYSKPLSVQELEKFKLFK